MFHGTGRSVLFAFPGLAGLAHKFALHRFFFAIADGGGLLEILPLLPLTNDTLFFDHALEALQGLLKGFVLVNSNLADGKSPPFNRGCHCTYPWHFVKPGKDLRVAGKTCNPQFPVKMRPGGQAGSADSAYWLLPDDQIAYIYSHLMQMHIDGIDPGQMLYHHRFPCYNAVLDQNDPATTGSPDRGSCRVPVIHAVMGAPCCTIVGIDITPDIAKEGGSAIASHGAYEPLVQVVCSWINRTKECKIAAGLLILPGVRINSEACQSLIQPYIIPPEVTSGYLGPEFSCSVPVPINNSNDRSSDRGIYRHPKEEHHCTGSDITTGMHWKGKALYGYKIPVIAFR